MDIEKVLQGYLENKARISVLQVRIDKAKQELGLSSQIYVEDERETISGMQMSAKAITHDKPSPTNKINSATETTALNYAEETEHKNDFDTFGIKRDIKVWEREIKQLEGQILEIERALSSLTKEENFIIQMLYFEKMYWRDIETSYQHTFKFYKSEDTLQKIRKIAMEKLKRVVA